MKILFVAEGVTLAQIVRLVTLARALDPAEHEVHFACARFDEAIFGGTSFVRHEIHSLSAARDWVVPLRRTRMTGSFTWMSSSDASGGMADTTRKVWRTRESPMSFAS